MHPALTMGAAAAVFAGLGWGGLRWFEHRNLFVPSRVLEDTPEAVGLAFESVDFVAEDHTRLHGWWIPHPEARGTVILCHGNAGNISHRLGLVRGLWDALAMNWFLFDYRGYGQSRGLPSEKGVYRDARAAFEVVRARYEDAENPPITVYGRSLGGAVALQLAVDKPVRAVAVEGAFASAVDVARDLFPILPVDSIMKHRFEARKRAEHLRIPKLFAHSRTDEVVPYRHGRALFEAAADPKEFVDLRGGHNDWPWETTPGYAERLGQFFQRTLDSGPPMIPPHE